MNFEFKRFNNDEIQNVVGRLKGPIFQLQNTYVGEHAKSIYFIDLGQVPQSQENNPPWFFNLLWSDQAIAIEARPHFVKEADGYVLQFDVNSIGIPHALSEDIEVIRQAVEMAVAAYWTALRHMPISARVILPRRLIEFKATPCTRDKSSILSMTDAPQTVLLELQHLTNLNSRPSLETFKPRLR
jgi:hypothetical protein